jgi:arylsulfatase
MISRIFLTAAAVLACFSLCQTARSAPPRPNIVIILADDMGYSDVGCYGSEISTPNIDKLAAGGVRFTQFYNTGRCCPTRASLLSGLYSHQAGVGHMTDPAPGHPGYSGELSRENARTIAEVLKPAGYATYMCGKWHVTSHVAPNANNENWPRQRGFDRYYGTIQGGGSYYDPAMLTRDNTPITPRNDPQYKPEFFYYTDAIADNSSRFIREHHFNTGEKPFFLYCAFTSPHWPLHAPAETIAKYKGKYDGGYEPTRAARYAKMKQLGLIDPKWELSPAPFQWAGVEKKDWEARCMEVYAAQVDRMDTNVGKIVDALSETGQLDNTLILFLSDNGGCAENTGRDVHQDRVDAKPKPARPIDKVQTQVFPMYTLDGKPIRDGNIVMPGPADTFMAYGKGWANVSNTPFREYKHFVHEGGISTPLIAHWPEGIKRHGDFERQPAHLVDLMATCVDLGGAKYLVIGESGHAITPMQGTSLVPAFRAQPLHREKPIFWEHEGNRAVREGKWKHVAKGAKGELELYDIDADPSEMHNLASKEPDRVKSMSQAWQQWAESSNVLPLNPKRPNEKK